MKNKISKYIDGEKLHNDMTARYENLRYMIEHDFCGDTTEFQNKWMEIKYWKEALERSVYDYEEDKDETDI